jgi:uncharacterized protein (TIGR02145 family)
MKNMTKTLALLLAVLAIGNSAHNSAQAQTQLQASKPYTFRGTPATTGGGAVTYQWYRDGQPIAGATDSIYVLPDHLAYGTRVQFKRGVVSSTCPGNVSYTNVVTVAFGMVVGAVNWASVNVAGYQAFASRPDQYTQFYQWNRAAAWAASGTVSNFPSVADNSTTWTINPCPANWRLPTSTEFTALINTGAIWAEASTRGNAVVGKFFGANNATCTLPNNMYGCIFLPAGGTRSGNSGSGFQGENGFYYSSTQVNSTTGYFLYFGGGVSATVGSWGSKQEAHNIRCVQGVE